MSDQQAEVPAVPGVTRWRKRPIEVEAIQVTEGCSQEVEAFLGDDTWCEWIMADPEQPGTGYRLEGLRMWVAERDGAATLKPGDWIVRELGDNPRPVAADVFAATYEPAGPPLTPSQCDRLRSMVTEYGDALSAVRRPLDLAGRPGLRSPEDADVIKAAREALRVLEGSEEEDGRG